MLLKLILDIRTYTVIPLNERCGLIEWVKDTKTFRSILVERYDLRNIRWFVRLFHFLNNKQY